MTIVARSLSTRCAKFIFSLSFLAGCAGNAVGSESEPVATASAQALQNADLVDVGGAVVEIFTAKGKCTATMINENSLLTAAHCGAQDVSHWPNIQVLTQENATTWRCLTALDGSGNAILGSEATVRSLCPTIGVGFGSMFDDGMDLVAYPGVNPGDVWEGYKNDFAVIKVWTPGFVWVGTGTGDYAAIYADLISSGTEWAYGMGCNSPTTCDGRVRRTDINVIYSDEYIVGGFAEHAQTCSGDSGGPLGVFMPNSQRYAVVAVASRMAAWSQATPVVKPGDPFCTIMDGGVYWSNAVSRISYIERAIGKTCRDVVDSGVATKECWN